MVRLSVVGPLIQSSWKQDFSNDSMDCDAYNYYFPFYDGMCPCQYGGYGNYPAGCVAVAMGQIMYYWKYPVWLPDTTCQIDWCKMGNTLLVSDPEYQRKKESISSFLKWCAQSVNMSYGYFSCISISYISTARNSLINTFNYHQDAVYRKKSMYSSSWVEMLKNDLDRGYPVLYRGENPHGASNGHAFICDGYTTNDYFHFNFGDFSMIDGYFTLNDIVPDIFDFSSKQAAVFNIHPAYTQDYCDFSLPLWIHYYNYYTVLGKTTPDPHENVPKTFTTLTSVPLDNAYPSSWRTISSGDTSEYVAHKEVVLQPGFTAEAGSDFVARIEPCADCEDDDGLRGQPFHKENVKDETLVETRHGTSHRTAPMAACWSIPTPLTAPSPWRRQAAAPSGPSRYMILSAALC